MILRNGGKKRTRQIHRSSDSNSFLAEAEDAGRDTLLHLLAPGGDPWDHWTCRRRFLFASTPRVQKIRIWIVDLSERIFHSSLFRLLVRDIYVWLPFLMHFEVTSSNFLLWTLPAETWKMFCGSLLLVVGIAATVMPTKTNAVNVIIMRVTNEFHHISCMHCTGIGSATGGPQHNQVRGSYYSQSASNTSIFNRKSIFLFYSVIRLFIILYSYETTESYSEVIVICLSILVSVPPRQSRQSLKTKQSPSNRWPRKKSTKPYPNTGQSKMVIDQSERHPFWPT